MPDDKPFEATSQRLARAKREGDLPRSADLNALASLVCAASTAFAVLPSLGAASREAIERGARGEVAGSAFATLAACVLTVGTAGLCGALVATYLQSRAFAFTFPGLKFEKLNPIPGLKKMVSRDAVLAGSKACVVASSLCTAVFSTLRAVLGSTVGSSAAGLAAESQHALMGAFAGAVAVALLFAAADVSLERVKWKRRLRMSFDELKRDMRQSEGDPHVKGKRRQAQRALARGSIAQLKDAAVVVTNPTHVAIALAYGPPAVPVPRVLVRAIDAGAREVKRRARACGIPIVENVALARALLATTGVGDVIPPATYGAVAAIVAALARERAVAG